MPNKRIDQLPISGNNVKGTDLVPIFSDNKTERISIDSLTSYIGSGATDTYVSGGTYDNGTLTIGRNDGTDLTVSGFLTGATDTYVSGGTYNNGTLTLGRNDGVDLIISGFTSEVNLGDVLYVSEFGDDSEALKGDPTKPYLTIKAAELDSVAGDVVHVYPGTYNEGANDWVKSDVTYYFEPNTFVINSSGCIDDNGLAKNIRIEGFGSFSGNGAIKCNNVATTVYIRGKDFVGNGSSAFSMDAGASFDIEGELFSTTGGYCINIRGNCGGRLVFDYINSNSTGQTILLAYLGTDLVERTIDISGRLIRSNASFSGSGVLCHIDINNTKVNYNNFFVDHYSGAAGGIYNSSGTSNSKTIFRNVSGISATGYGLQPYSSGSLQLSDCDFRGVTYAINAGAEKIYARNSYFKQINNGASSNGAIQISGSAELDLQNCVVELDSTSATRKCLNVLNDNVRISNTKLIATPTQTESIGVSTSVARNIIVESQCSTNRPTSAFLTNVVVGTSIIVDSNIGKNSKTLL